MVPVQFSPPARRRSIRAPGEAGSAHAVALEAVSEMATALTSAQAGRPWSGARTDWATYGPSRPTPPAASRAGPASRRDFADGMAGFAPEEESGRTRQGCGLHRFASLRVDRQRRTVAPQRRLPARARRGSAGRAGLPLARLVPHLDAQVSAAQAHSALAACRVGRASRSRADLALLPVHRDPAPSRHTRGGRAWHPPGGCTGQVDAASPSAFSRDASLLITTAKSPTPRRRSPANTSVVVEKLMSLPSASSKAHS